jgi:tetratricopeptide (TPR) repeat protein
LPFEALADIMISSVRYSKEGDRNLGYKIAVEFPGSKPMDAFVVYEEEQFRIVEFSPDPSKVPESIGWEVLARLEDNDLAGARHWLDWAREMVHLDKGDDPLSGQPFAHFWTKGQEGDAGGIRTAALVLLASKELTGDTFTALVHARDMAKTDEDRIQINLAVAHACSEQQRWSDLLPVAEELLKAAPDSLIAFQFASSAYQGLKKFDDWEKLVQSRLQKHPGDPDYIRAQARLLEDRGEIAAARALIKGLIDRSKATDSDLNQYAWDALVLPGKIDQEAIDAAQRANELTKNANFGILHTLACLYAEQGKTAEARELLLKAMNVGNMEEPNSEIWFGFAKIAEQYGEPEAARAMYSRMEKPKLEYPTSSYHLAQQRLAELRNSGSSTAKNGGHQ